MLIIEDETITSSGVADDPRNRPEDTDSSKFSAPRRSG